MQPKCRSNSLGSQAHLQLRKQNLAGILQKESEFYNRAYLDIRSRKQYPRNKIALYHDHLFSTFSKQLSSNILTRPSSVSRCHVIQWVHSNKPCLFLKDPQIAFAHQYEHYVGYSKLSTKTLHMVLSHKWPVTLNSRA